MDLALPAFPHYTHRLAFVWGPTGVRLTLLHELPLYLAAPCGGGVVLGRPPPPLFARVEKQRRRPGGEVGRGGSALSGCSSREEGGEAAPATRRAAGWRTGASGTESEVAASSRRWIRRGPQVPSMEQQQRINKSIMEENKHETCISC